MSNLLDRIICAWNAMFGARVLVIKTTKGKGEYEGKDKVTLYGTIADNNVQVEVLRRLATSIQDDIDKNTTMTRGTEAGDKVIRDSNGAEHPTVFRWLVERIQPQFCDLLIQEDGKVRLTILMKENQLVNAECFMLCHCDEELPIAFSSMRKYLIGADIADVFLKAIWDSGSVKEGHINYQQLKKRYSSS